VRPAAFAVALALSLAPLALERFGLLELAGAPRVGLALLPWLALAGLPRPASRELDAGAAWLAPLAALPLVALAAAVDRAAPGPAGSGAVWTAAVGLALVALLALAAARGARVFAAAWFALVCAPTALATAFSLSASGGDDALGGGAGPAVVGAWFGAWLGATPLVWAARTIAGGADDRGLGPLAPIGVAALLAAIALVEAAGARRAERAA